MIRMLVVEDESVIRDGLLRHVSWRELEIGEVRSAANAGEALKLCREYSPDIISADISMPGMNGVELCTRLRESFPDLAIIFVTGYSDKEYLKAAITLHAIRYVEKPIQRKEYSEAVAEAVRHVRQTRLQKASRLRTLTYGAEEELPLTAKYHRVGLLHLEQTELLAEIRDSLAAGIVSFQREYEFTFLTELRDSDNILFLAGYNKSGSDPGWGKILQCIRTCIECCTQEKTRWFLSWGCEARTPEQIRESWNRAFNGLSALSYLGWNHGVTPEDWENTGHDGLLPAELAEAFTNAVVADDAAGQKNCLEELYRFLLDQKVFMRGDIRFLYLNWYRLLQRAYRQRNLAGSLPEDPLGNEQFFEAAQTFQELHEFMLERIAKHSREAGEKDTESSSYVVQKVMDHISGHYGDRELSIRTLADLVGLTPTYLSNLFKKETGVTIGQYLMDVRIGMARHLMKDPQKKLYEVADLVGYEDVNYFTRVFKRATGMTPSEYRRKQL